MEGGNQAPQTAEPTQELIATLTTSCFMVASFKVKLLSESPIQDQQGLIL